MTQIGKNHGVTAAINRFRAKDPYGTLLEMDSQGKWRYYVDGVPSVKVGIDALVDANVPLDRWRAYDKWERSLLILVTDHDAGGPSPFPQRPRTWFDGHWAYVRGPASGYEVEKLQAVKNARYTGVALNVGDHAPEEWARWRDLAAWFQVSVIPWARTYTKEGVERIVQIGSYWMASTIILNLEQNPEEPRWSVTGEEVYEALKLWAGGVGLSTEPYLPDNFNWVPLAQEGCVCLPQTHILEFPDQTPQVVVDRAEAFGFYNPVPSLGTYTYLGEKPYRWQYNWLGYFGIYTLDDISYDEVALWV